jgi:DNA polymerase I-like protein with 3'-5' exonuclease and polymerase domains
MTTIYDVRTSWQLDVLEDDLTSSPFVYFDLETTNDGKVDEAHEDWHPHSRITAASFTTRPGTAYTLPLSHPEGAWSSDWREIAARVFKLLARPNVRLGGHNAKFDVRWVHSTTGIDLVDRLTWDTMVAAYVLDENEPKGLKHLAVTELGVPDWSEEIDSRRTEQAPWSLVKEYAGRDTDHGFQLMQLQRERLREEPGLARVFGLLMMPVVRAVTRIERNGLYLDEAETVRRLAEAEARIVEVEDDLLDRYVSPLLKEEFCWRHYKTKPSVPVRPSWSPNSKFFHAFMADVGAPVIERTAKKGTPSFSEGVMKRLSATGAYPYIDAILEARKLGKDVGYLRSWLAKRDAEGYLHPTLKPAHVTTGRLSSSNPNAQQVSRHLKDCFVAPEGWHFVQADYAQVELRIAAMLAHEEAMIAAFREGQDLHRIMASKIAGCEPHEVTKGQRQAAKAVNFGFLYGMGAAKFVDYAFDEYGVTFTIEEAARIRSLFFATWPRLAEWHEEQRRTAHTHGYVRSPLGRRRRLPDLRSALGGQVAAAERQAINAPVQSFASDLMLLSLITLDRMPSVNRRTCGTVHDSGLHYVREGHVKAELGRIAEAMLYPPTKTLFGVELTVPLEVEMLVGTSWGDEDARVVVVSTQPSTST